MEYVRTFLPYQLPEILAHLLITGDLTADCAACRALGIDAYSAKNCPQCGTEFKYAASRRLDTHAGERFQWARRMHEKRPDLILLDYSDFMKAQGQKKARDFFA